MNPGVSVLPAQGDVRHYILNADVVVGFQTTALLEALACGRPTIYTWWTDAVKEHEGDLIPFHREVDALAVATSPAELERLLEGHLRNRASPSSGAKALVTRYLGPIDGRAAERCWSRLEDVRAAMALTAAGKRLRRGGHVLRFRTAMTSAAAVCAWGLGTALAPLAYAAYRLVARLMKRPAPIDAEAFRRELRSRRRGAVDRLVAVSTW